MSRVLFPAGLLLAFATSIQAQFGPPDGGDPFGGPGSGGPGGPPFGFGSGFFDNKQHMIIAHAVLATVAFALVFPLGGIMIRLGSFRGVAIVHGLLQIIGGVMFVGAVVVGVNIADHLNLLQNKHPIIGFVLLGLLILQPFLGVVHHYMFKRNHKRTGWSYAHIWLGRIVITLGIVNGGLGLQLAQRTHFFAPGQGAVIGYSVAAAVIWLLYIASAIYGEGKRSKAQRQQHLEYASKRNVELQRRDEPPQYA